VAQEDAGNQRATAADCTAASRSSVELACRGPTRRRRRPSRIPPAARPLLYTPDVREPDAAREAGTDFGRGVRHRKVDDVECTPVFPPSKPYGIPRVFLCWIELVGGWLLSQC
jgi:hypothetical protein